MISREELLEQLGSPYTNQVVPRLHRFAYVPDSVLDKLDKLAKDALTEHWGASNFVLRKYIAAHLPWSIAVRRKSVH